MVWRDIQYKDVQDTYRGQQFVRYQTEKVTDCTVILAFGDFIGGERIVANVLYCLM